MAKKRQEPEVLIPSVKDEVKVVFMDTAQRTADFILRRYGVRIPIELHPSKTFTDGFKIYVDQTLEKYDNQDVNELMKSKLIHEIGHILFSSFAWTSDHQKNLLSRQVKVYPNYYNEIILQDANNEKILSSYRQLCEDWFITKKLSEGYFGSSDMLNKAYMKAYPNIENAEHLFENMSWGQRFGWLLFYRLMADTFISHREAYMHNFRFILSKFTDTKLFWDHFFLKGYFDTLQKASTSEQICDALFPFTNDIKRMFKQAENKKKQKAKEQHDDEDGDANEEEQDKKDQLGQKDTEEKPLNENEFNDETDDNEDSQRSEDEHMDTDEGGLQPDEEDAESDDDVEEDEDTDSEEETDEEDGNEDGGYDGNEQEEQGGYDDTEQDDEGQDEEVLDDEDGHDYDEHNVGYDDDEVLPDDLEDDFDNYEDGDEDGDGNLASSGSGDNAVETDEYHEGEMASSENDANNAISRDNIFDQLDMDNINGEDNAGVAEQMDQEIDRDKHSSGSWWHGPERDFHAEPFIIQNDEIINVAEDPRYVNYMKVSEDIYKREISKYMLTIQTLLNTVYDRLFSKSDALRVASKTGKKYRSVELLKIGNFEDYTSHLPKYDTITQEEKSIAVSILVDNSGSMLGDKIETARGLTFILAEVFKNANVAFEITGFTTTQPPSPEKRRGYRENRNFSPRYLCAINLIHKSFGSDNVYPLGSMGMLGMQNNVDGASVEYASMELMKRGEDRKLFFLLSDGEPSGYKHTEAGMEHIKYAREVMEENDVEFFSIGIQNGYMKLHPDKSDYYYGKDKWVNIETTQQAGLLVSLFDKITSKII